MRGENTGPHICPWPFQNTRCRASFHRLSPILPPSTTGLSESSCPGPHPRFKFLSSQFCLPPILASCRPALFTLPPKSPVQTLLAPYSYCPASGLLPSSVASFQASGPQPLPSNTPSTSQLEGSFQCLPLIDKWRPYHFAA